MYAGWSCFLGGSLSKPVLARSVVPALLRLAVPRALAHQLCSSGRDDFRVATLAHSLALGRRQASVLRKAKVVIPFDQRAVRLKLRGGSCEGGADCVTYRIASDVQRPADEREGQARMFTLLADDGLENHTNRFRLCASMRGLGLECCRRLVDAAFQDRCMSHVCEIGCQGEGAGAERKGAWAERTVCVQRGKAEAQLCVSHLVDCGGMRALERAVPFCAATGSALCSATSRGLSGHNEARSQ